MVSGLAASIRASEESETFDLAGQNATTITSTIQSAFEEPFVLDCMIRITFVTGAGKQARAKYDDGAAKAVTSVLNKYGYQDDRGASCVLECAGSYKLQHDTGKNLKTVVVFPKVTTNDDNDSGPHQAEPLIPKNSEGYKIAIMSMNVFKNMINSKCPSWSQKKGCLSCIEALLEILQELDAKLMDGTSLNDSEQSYYDDVVSLDEKALHVKHEMNNHIETGRITKFELETLLKQNSERIEALKNEKKSTAKALQRKELLESIQPISPHKLRLEEEIRKFRKELTPLLQLEAVARGRLLSVKETQTLARKDEIVEEIEYLENASRGWFEDDEAFESRVQASRDVYAEKRKKKAAKAALISSDTKVRMSATKFVTPGQGRVRSKGSSKIKNRVKGGGVFSAMIMDSDSDSDNEVEEEEDEDEIIEQEGNENADAPIDPTTQKTKKKKKKKKKPKQDASPAEGDVSNEGEEEDEKTTLARANSFLQTYIIPFLMAFLRWFVGLLFGKPKKSVRPK